MTRAGCGMPRRTTQRISTQLLLSPKSPGGLGEFHDYTSELKFEPIVYARAGPRWGCESAPSPEPAPGTI